LKDLQLVVRQIAVDLLDQLVSVKVAEDLGHTSADHGVQIQRALRGTGVGFEAIASLALGKGDTELDAGALIGNSAVEIHKDDVSFLDLALVELEDHLNELILAFSLQLCGLDTVALTDDQKELIDEDTYKKLTDAEDALNSLVLLGDADGDGEVTAVDATVIQRSLMDLGKLSDQQVKAADVDGDGEVTIVDATLIQRYLAGMTVKFPINEYV
jgi:hypothetical protein